MTTASRSLATALWGVRFARVWLPSRYTTWGDTTFGPPSVGIIIVLFRGGYLHFRSRGKGPFFSWIHALTPPNTSVNLDIWF